MSRLTAGGRLERLLSLVPWVVANDGPRIADVAARFDYPEQSLVSDLQILFMVGIYPHTPDQLVEVVIEDARVWIRYAEYFERPLRLTPAQALALVTAARSLMSVPGADPSGPLARGLDKLAATLGVNPGDEVDVDLGAAPAALMSTVRDGVERRRRLRIEYYAYGRDELTVRDVDPLRLTSDQGAWYLLAFCHRAEQERTFRVDRIRSAEPTGDTFEAPSEVSDRTAFVAGADDPRVTLRLAPAAAWVPEHHPVETIDHLEDGWLRVTMAISARPWLERLLLRLGPDAVVEAIDPRLGSAPDIAAVTAARVLARYRDANPSARSSPVAD